MSQESGTRTVELTGKIACRRKPRQAKPSQDSAHISKRKYVVIPPLRPVKLETLKPTSVHYRVCYFTAPYQPHSLYNGSGDYYERITEKKSKRKRLRPILKNFREDLGVDWH
jgi:hypothetical protein